MRVGLLVTCLVDLFRPSIGFSALALLERAGVEVVVPARQTCCGQPAYNSGDRQAARALALKTLTEFEHFDYVVIPSGSCAGMVGKHYPQLFDDDSDTRQRITALAARTFELTDFLINVLHLTHLPGRWQGRLTYHDSCAGLRELGVKNQPRALLASADIELIEMTGAEVCCGFGGTFSVKFGDIATRMADNKCLQIAATGAPCVALGDLGCMLHIEGRLRRRGDMTTQVLHIAEVLAAQDRAGVASGEGDKQSG
ncbi:MAG: (Fe-S)-binding protein [Burkholderiales bacterium]|nr:(Fe-S)-binding protein [Pseudomonadota bacterium]